MLYTKGKVLEKLEPEAFDVLKISFANDTTSMCVFHHKQFPESMIFMFPVKEFFSLYSKEMLPNIYNFIVYFKSSN